MRYSHYIHIAAISYSFMHVMQIDDAETAAASIFQLCNIGLPNLKWHHRLAVSLKYKDIMASTS